MLEVSMAPFPCCEVAFPRRRVFSVKIWMTAVPSGDENDEEENVFMCPSPLFVGDGSAGCRKSFALQKTGANLASLAGLNGVDLCCPGHGEAYDVGEWWDDSEECAASVMSDFSSTSNSTSDTSTEGSISPDLSVDKASYPLNVNAPAFKDVSSMTPVIITKNIEINNERWKPSASIVEENVNSITLPPEMPQPFLGADGLYYTVLLEPIKPLVNGDAGIHHHLPVGMHGPDVAMNPTSVPPMETPPGDLSEDELKKMIQLQFEYYFSRENLANDSYLVSQMDSDQYVPISTIAKFNQIKRLTSDTSLIIEALKESPYVQLDLDKQKVRANMKRCIVILREIPESTPIEEVKALFSHPNCPPWSSFEFAHNDSWYITFDSEEDAKRAYRYLREDVQNFQGRPLMARIKAKTLLSRSVYMPKSVSGSASSAGVTPSSVTEPKAQFPAALQPQPLSPFPTAPGVGPGSAIYQQPQSFQYYAAVSQAPLMAGPWLTGHRPRLMHQEMRSRPSLKHSTYIPNAVAKGGNIARPFFQGGKGRQVGRNGPGPNHVPFSERNGFADSDEVQLRQASAPGRRPNNHSLSNGNVPPYRRETDTRIPSQTQQPAKKDRRLEEIPRFQRLRQERVKRAEVTSLTKPTDDFSTPSLMALDLAPENFPALPSPNSPKERLSGASSLKELASTALQQSKLCDDSVNLTEIQPCEERTRESSVDESMTNAGLLTTTAVANSSAQALLPRMSYAQMAQKPQPKGSHQESCDFTPLSPADVEISGDYLYSGNIEKAACSSVPEKVQKRKGDKINSPEIQRTNSAKSNLSSTFGKPGQDGSTDGGSKECSYRTTVESSTSKNGGLRNNGPTCRPQPAPVYPSHGRALEGSQAPASSNLNSRLSGALPPRPLMSQIIQLPENRLRELENQRSPTFSETVRKSFTMDQSKKSLSSSLDEPECIKSKSSSVNCAPRLQDSGAEISSAPAACNESHSEEERK